MDRHGFCQEEIKKLIASFHKNLGKITSWELEKQIHLGAYVSYLLNFVVLMLKFGAQAYFDSSKGFSNLLRHFWHMLRNTLFCLVQQWIFDE